ncbi:vWA domain-containing protein [Rheinheimera texasensis]|uniref:vWA domain-containing protein n=1 Tax=Rheinheimera texasensis TaxID=306205 RepID=UPI0004E0F441|nr:VWA domain-containing protein [Rheinheimera texasensis]
MPFEIHFLRPYALLLLPLVLLCWLLLRRLPLTDAWQQMLAPHLYQQLLSAQTVKRRQHWLWPLLLLLGIMAAAGPSWQKLPQPAFQLKRATVLVLDMSMSMRATDIKPNRVTQARFKALDYAKAQLEGEMALLAFAGDAYVISPLTPDHNNISLLLPDLKPEIMPVQGSDFAGALKLADQLLQQAGYVKGDIIFFTDGFDSQQFTQIRDQLNGFRHRVSVLAFGQTDGAPIQLENGELLKDSRGGIVLPKVPLSQLRELSALTGGAFAQSSFDNSDISKLLALPALTLNEDAAPSAMQGDQWQDAGVYLCYLLLILALLALRQQQLLVLPLLLMLWPQPVPAADEHSSQSQPAESAAPSGWQWQDLWQSRNEQASKAYDAGDYAAAQAKFTDPLWQGNAAYRAGDYAGAASLFAQDKSAAGLFNLGNSLALQQQYQQALAAYQQAAQQQADLPGLQDNIRLMQKLLEQQQDQQEKQSKDQQQSQDQQQDGEQKDGEQKDRQEQQDQQNQQQSQEQQQDEQNKQNGAESDPTQQQQTEQQKQQQLQQAEAEQQSEQPDQQQQAIEQAWPNASPEQSQQLENLLRKVQDEPSLLLKNKMLLEYQKRQQQAVPRGVQQEW